MVCHDSHRPPHPHPIRGHRSFRPVPALLGAWRPVDQTVSWLLQCCCTSEFPLLFRDLRSRQDKTEGGSEEARNTGCGLGEHPRPRLGGRCPGSKVSHRGLRALQTIPSHMPFGRQGLIGLAIPRFPGTCGIKGSAEPPPSTEQ